MGLGIENWDTTGVAVGGQEALVVIHSSGTRGDTSGDARGECSGMKGVGEEGEPHGYVEVGVEAGMSDGSGMKGGAPSKAERDIPERRINCNPMREYSKASK